MQSVRRHAGRASHARAETACRSRAAGCARLGALLAGILLGGALLGLPPPVSAAPEPRPGEGGRMSATLDEAGLEALRQQVREVECAFAASMARRDLAAFTGLLSADTVFFNGSRWLRGPAQVREGWKAYFDGPQAPFSWAPDQVEVIGDGSLAQSTGLVRNPQGKVVGRFVSVWRQEAPGRWRIVIDRGVPLSEAERAAAEAPATPGCG